MSETNNHTEQLVQLFYGVVWDGDLISKNSRDELVNAGLVMRCRGYNIITSKGIEYVLDQGLISQESEAELSKLELVRSGQIVPGTFGSDAEYPHQAICNSCKYAWRAKGQEVLERFMYQISGGALYFVCPVCRKIVKGEWWAKRVLSELAVWLFLVRC